MNCVTVLQADFLLQDMGNAALRAGWMRGGANVFH